MATNLSKRQGPEPKSSVIQWLLDSDPSIRWQAIQDLIGAPADEVAAERARVATEGAGARLLALQGADGRSGWRGVEPRVGLHHARPVAPAGDGSRSRQRRGKARGGPRPRARDVARMRSAGSGR